jgi:hypothetical protein
LASKLDGFWVHFGIARGPIEIGFVRCGGDFVNCLHPQSYLDVEMAAKDAVRGSWRNYEVASVGLRSERCFVPLEVGSDLLE